MIELKFTVDEDCSKNELRQLLSLNDYICVIEEIKSTFRNLLKHQDLNGHTIEMTESNYLLVESIQDAVYEICKDLPEIY
jgi:hypothetical protein